MTTSAHVPVDDIAVRCVVGMPEGVEDVISGVDGATRVPRAGPVRAKLQISAKLSQIRAIHETSGMKNVKYSQLKRGRLSDTRAGGAPWAPSVTIGVMTDALARTFRAALASADAATPHPDHLVRRLYSFPSRSPDEHPEMTDSRAEFTRIVQGVDDSPPGPGEVALATCLADARATGPFGALPLAVVSAGRPGEYPPDFPKDIGHRVDAFGREMQRDLTRLSTRSVQLIPEQSGRIIPQDQREIVVEAIRQIVGMARGNTARMEVS